MDNFTFYNPTRVIFGRDTIKQIGPAIKKSGGKKVLFVAGGGSIKKNGVYDAAVRSLEKSGIERVELWGVRANPVLSKVREGIETARRNEVDSVLAVGGGSVIDSAKSIAAGFYMEDIWDAYESKTEIREALPVYTVLTISAAGSEMDQFAVLTSEREHRKWNIASELLYPRVSVIDPAVQSTLPWSQTVNGALDALAHIMEYYFLGDGGETTVSVDEALMMTIIEKVDTLRKDPRDDRARASLAWAATMALNGTSGAGLKGGDWTSHWIEHAISAYYPDIAHGAGLGVIFPAWITYVNERGNDIFTRWARNIWGEDDAGAAAKKMKDKLREWGAPVSLDQLGIKEKDLRKIAAKTMEIGDVGVLVRMNEEHVMDVLKLALYG